MDQSGLAASPDQILDELGRLLKSPLFARSLRQAKLLEYLCTKTLTGQQDKIKEYTIAVEVFGRPESFDQAPDSVVRAEVFRIRRKLERYYQEDGRNAAVRIVLPVGHYIPHFVVVADEKEPPSFGKTGVLPPSNQPAGLRAPAPRRLKAAAGVTAVLIAAGALYWLLFHRPAVPPPPVPAAGAPQDTVRILAGYSKGQYRDRFGNVWMGDRYFSGGASRPVTDWTGANPIPFVFGSYDHGLFQGLHEGDATYTIPVRPGIYELRLYFAEFGYGPSKASGAGENRRIFDIDLNGAPLVSNLDIFAAAGASDTSLGLVFTDVSPEPDGYIRLRFRSRQDRATVSAIEIVPGLPGRMHPVRMVVGEQFYTDSEGREWTPDRFFTNGRVSASPTAVAGTPDPGLYANERYGNFSYVIPAARGRYTVRLHMAETYFGRPSAGGEQAAGKRLFDILCNGVALVRDYEILKAAGGFGRAATLTFRSLEPSPQGSLRLSFLPVRNYASVRAIEVTAEARR